MTERARRLVGGDDCQNRAARRYEKCSYLWHYFRRFEPFRRFPRSPLSARLANRTPVPLPPPLSPRTRPDLLYLPTAVVSQSAPFLLPLLVALLLLRRHRRRRRRPPPPPPAPSPLASSFVTPTQSPHSASGRGPHHRWVRTAGRLPPPPRALL